MNRILFEREEIENGVAKIGDARAAHIIDVLGGEAGQELKVGVVDGKVGTGRILSVEGGQVEVAVDAGIESPAPWFDLVLAPPRPRVFKRILPQLAALGLRRLTLTGAKKVEKDFWGATILRRENYRPLLIEGLQQAGTSILPEIQVERSFRRLLSQLDPAEGPRIVAHPYGNFVDVPAPEPGRIVTFAVGPEGGWTEAEVEALEAKGFLRFSLGSRILRTDTALVALIAKFMQP